jgi:hypothetical protein
MGGLLMVAGNVGLQSLNRPAGEGTLKEAPQWEIDDVLLGGFCLSRRKMLMNSFSLPSQL